MNANSAMSGIRSSEPSGDNRAMLPAARLDAIEWARVIAACGVVWFHLPLGQWKEFGHAGLVAFILIAVVFQAMGSEKEGLGSYLRKKAERVMPPWLVWFCLYAFVNLARGKEVFPYSSGIVSDLFAGPWIGLWFLPFFMASSLVVYIFSRVSSRMKPWVETVFFLGFGLALLTNLPKIQGLLPLEAPWAQWLHACPAVPIGMGIRGILKFPENSRLVVGFGFLIVMSGLMAVFSTAYWNLAINYGLAVGLVVPAYLVRIHLWKGITRLGGLCLGVYLIHPVFMGLMKKLPLVGESALAILAGTLAFSFFTTAVIKKWPLTARIC